jgi:hypothetical protein
MLSGVCFSAFILMTLAHYLPNKHSAFLQLGEQKLCVVVGGCVELVA